MTQRPCSVVQRLRWVVQRPRWVVQRLRCVAKHGIYPTLGRENRGFRGGKLSRLIRATPSPVGAPGTPTDFSATLNPDGSLKLKWKCPNPAGSVGTIYQISRRTGATGTFASVGGTGARSFIDNSVPAGVASVTYQITAVRSTAIGTAAQFIVNLGVESGSGEVVASVVSAPKLAA